MTFSSMLASAGRRAGVVLSYLRARANEASTAAALTALAVGAVPALHLQGPARTSALVTAALSGAKAFLTAEGNTAGAADLDQVKAALTPAPQTPVPH